MDRPISYTYAALFLPEEDGRYSVFFPQLEGCITEGDSFEDARRMATEAMSLHLYGMEQDGEKPPEPNLAVNSDPGQLVVPITAWMTPFRDEMENRAVKKTLTIPYWLNEAAEKRGVNYSQILQSALKDYLHIYAP